MNMIRTLHSSLGVWARPSSLCAGALAGLLACTPLGNLDDASRGKLEGDAGHANGGLPAEQTGGRAAVGGAGEGGRAHGGARSSGGGGTAELGGASASGGELSTSEGGRTQDGGEGGASFGGASSAGTGGNSGVEAGAIGAGGSTTGRGGRSSGGSAGQQDAPALPIDLPNSPVNGTFTVSAGASWEVDGVQVPTFEIHTPSASYWVVKQLGMIVSIVDLNGSGARQWIDYSTGFRPLRGLPSYGTFAASESMTTTVDQDSQTPTHLRLFSNSKSGNWRLVWDFYPTHVTVTINAAPRPYGFAYRGVPGGLLDGADLFVLPDGTSADSQLSYVSALPGPVQWAYVADTKLGRSLFLIQHSDDDVVDRYQVKDNDSALLSFGDGKLTELPLRFSFGIVQSSVHAEVKQRAQFVIDAIH